MPSESEANFGMVISSPVGPLTLAASTRGLTGIRFGSRNVAPDRPESVHLRDARLQLAEYFAGSRFEFTLPLDVHGTPFQLRVWELLSAIPYGETTTYGQLAVRLGNPNLSRAVGRANGANPVPIVRPCHRVIGHNGHPVGFGGGLDRKVILLRHESRQGQLFQL